MPTFRRWQAENHFANFLVYELYSGMAGRLGMPWPDSHGDRPGLRNTTGEAVFSIERLVSDGSQEIDWYKGLLKRLRDQVRQDGGELLVVLVPLS